MVLLGHDRFLWLAKDTKKKKKKKIKSWKLLEHLKTYVEGPWLCFGDFNAILHSSEKQSTRHHILLRLMRLGRLWRVVN